MKYIVSKRIEHGGSILYNVEVAQSNELAAVEDAFNSIRKTFLEFLDKRKVRGLVQGEKRFEVYFYYKKLNVGYTIVYTIEEVSEEFFDLCLDTIGTIQQ